MSAPATNDFSPAPVITTQRTVSSCRSPAIVACSSSSVALLSALRTFGRFTVTIAVAPSRSSARFSGRSV